MKNQLKEMKSKIGDRYIQLVAEDGMFLIDLKDFSGIGNRRTLITELNENYETIYRPDLLADHIFIVGSGDKNTVIFIDIPEELED